MVFKKQISSEKQVTPITDTADKEQDAAPPIPVTVGIGASAGGHEALEHLFGPIPTDCGLTFVVVMHLSAEGPSLLADILRHHTFMKVLNAEDGMPLRPNTVYVPPLGKNLTVSGGRFRFHTMERGSQPHHPIDSFFTSLAADLGPCAIAVVLSGFGSDGSEGVKRVKEGGGIVLIQEPETAINPFMPQNAIATGAADAILTAEEIGDRLGQMARGNGTSLSRTLLASMDKDLHPLFTLLKTKTSHDFSSYKRNTVLRRTERRMVATGARELNEYLDIVEKDPLEAQFLCQELLIGVTSFFRDSEAFELLRSKIVPTLFTNRDTEEPVRIWHACCATGEEAYSLAMLILEHLEKENLQAKVQIFATDLDEMAVAQARAGIYSDDITSGISKERLERFFTKAEGGWQVTKQLREMIVFANHNLIKDPPFSRLNLLVCRNFLIYLNPDVQKLLIPLFHQVLNPGGFLFLGSAETVGPHSDLFSPVDKKCKIYIRQGGKSSRVDPFFPFSGSVRKLADIESSIRSSEAQETATVTLVDQYLMERYLPARILINEKNEVVHFSKRADEFLLTPEGKPTRDLLKIAKEELRPALRAAIYKAFTNQKEIDYRGIKVVTDSVEKMVNIVVVPLKEQPSAGKLALVIIEPAVPSSLPPIPSNEGGPDEDGSRNSLTRHLEEQLRVTGEQLQSTSDQLETSNERYMLANEELMTVNEELQSTNEELQSTNEELVTVNSELQRKMEELNQSNSDLENLFASSEIATIFLDRALLIKRYSPAMAAIINLIPADIDRPIHHLNSTIDWSDLPLDAKSVLEKLEPIEREANSLKDDRSFIMRILPYWTTEGIVDGIVITLLDISERKRAEVSLQESEKRFRTMANAMSHLAWIAQPDGFIVWYNQRWYEYTGTSPEEMEGWGWQSVHDPLALPKVLEQWQGSISTGEPFNMEFPLRGVDGNFRWFLTRGVPLKNDLGNIVQWFGTNTDVTEIKEAEDTLRRYELLAGNSRDIILFFRRDDLSIFEANVAAMEAYGYDHEEMLQLTLLNLRASDDTDLLAAQMADADIRGILFETVHRRKDGTTFPVEVSSRGATIGDTRMLLSVIRDITERKQAENAVYEAAEQRRLALEAAGLGSWDYNFKTGDVFWDEQCRNMWSIQEGDRIDYNAAIDQIHPDDRVDTDEAVNRALSGANEGAFHREFRLVWPDGSEHWIASHGRVYFERDGDLRRPVRFVGVNREITEHKRSEEANARLAAIVESSEDAIVATDLKSIIFSWNTGAERLFGYSFVEAIGHPITMLIPPEIKDDEPQMLQRLLAGERINHFETVRLTKDGRKIDVSLTVSTIKNSEGRIIGISKTARDITERKQAEEDLRQSEAQYHTLFNTLIEGFCTIEMVFDTEGRPVDYRFLEINPAFEKQTGLNDVQGQLMGDLAPENEKYWCEIYGKVALTGEPVRFENEAKALGRYYDVCAYKLGELESRKVAILFNDITERKCAEEEVRRNELGLRRLVDILQYPAPTIQDLLDNALEQAIQLTESKIGYIYHYNEESKELVLNSWSKEVLPACAVANPQTCYELEKTGIWGEAVRQRRPFIENDFMTGHPLKKGYPEGHVQLFKFATIPVFKNDRIVYVVGLANKETDYDETDILQISLLMDAVRKVTDNMRSEEENVKLEAQLVQAQKMEAIGTLAGGIAHDFNNILGAIIGYAEMAREASPSDSAIARDLDKVLEAGKRATDLVKQILSFSRQASTNRIPLEPAHLVKEALKLLRPALPSTIIINQQLDSVTRPILADPTQIHQIVMNLCTNAFHAMEQTGGILTITLKECILSPRDLPPQPELQVGTFVVLSIGDTGPGIEPAIRDKIFEPYFTTKQVGKGTGMGLSIVHGIVSTMGGFITCEGELGEGTIFHVFFPAVEREVASGIKPIESVVSGEESILFIDDEEMLAEMGQVMLERLGYKVTVRTSSIDALATFQNQPGHFDAVITDQTMPGMTGMDMARRMLQIRPDLPIILCTGYSTLIDEEQARANGIKGFIMKPMSKKDIAQLLRVVLGDRLLD